MLAEGQQLGGYRLLHRIVGAYPCGRPGGHVYLAADMLLQQYVAIKVFDIQGVTASDSSVSREVDSLLKHGTSTIAGLEHPHLLPLLDSGQIEIALTQYPYVVMPFCQEGSLTHWLEQHRPSHLL